MKLFQGFGMTEINIVAYSREGDALEPGCAGAILDEWFEVKIVDPETDEFRPVNGVGEIVVLLEAPVRLHGRLFPHAGEDDRGVAVPLVPHRRRRPPRR